MSDLTAFLHARLAEDEAAAKRATPGPWRQDGMGVWGQPPSYAAGTGKTMVIRHTWPQEADHILRHDPARVLRDVEARRAILRRCSACMDELDIYPNGLVSPRAFLARQTITDLAATYSDHPDYRAEWKP